MDIGIIVLKLQEVGLKVNHSNLRLDRWTDVKHLDGHTYGYIVNTSKNWCTWLRRGTDVKGGFRLDQNTFIPNKQYRQQIRKQQYEEKQAYFNKSCEIATTYFNIEDLGSTSPYLSRKKVQKYGCKTDVNGSLIIPLRTLVIDNDGNVKSFIRTMQIIYSTGFKLFTEGGQKKGSMHLLNFPKSLMPKLENKATMLDYKGNIVICEGYATAATVAQITGYPSIMAIDAGNIKPVLEQISKAYPQARIIIAADNDIKLRETTKGSGRYIWANTGVEAAIQCLNSHPDCCIAIPDFTYIKDGNIDGLTDWNDLALLAGFSVAAQIFYKQTWVSIDKRLGV